MCGPRQNARDGKPRDSATPTLGQGVLAPTLAASVMHPQPLMVAGATGPTGHSVGRSAPNAEPASATTPHPRMEERTARAKNQKARTALEAIVHDATIGGLNRTPSIPTPGVSRGRTNAAATTGRGAIARRPASTVDAIINILKHNVRQGRTNAAATT